MNFIKINKEEQGQEMDLIETKIQNLNRKAIQKNELKNGY